MVVSKSFTVTYKASSPTHPDMVLIDLTSLTEENILLLSDLLGSLSRSVGSSRTFPLLVASLLLSNFFQSHLLIPSRLSVLRIDVTSSGILPDLLRLIFPHYPFSWHSLLPVCFFF